MRFVFTGYVLMIAVGLAWGIAIGLVNPSVQFVRDNGLSLFFGALLVAAVVGESFAGQQQFNAQAVEHGERAISWSHYVRTPEFAGDLLENWQSEFLQFSLYIFATVWLIQRGSNESKKPGEEGLESDEQQRVGAYAEADSPAWAKARGAPPLDLLQLAASSS